MSNSTVWAMRPSALVSQQTLTRKKHPYRSGDQGKRKPLMPAQLDGKRDFGGKRVFFRREHSGANLRNWRTVNRDGPRTSSKRVRLLADRHADSLNSVCTLEWQRARRLLRIAKLLAYVF
jgi:hypothetical protein